MRVKPVAADRVLPFKILFPKGIINYKQNLEIVWHVSTDKRNLMNTASYVVEYRSVRHLFEEFRYSYHQNLYRF